MSVESINTNMPVRHGNPNTSSQVSRDPLENRDKEVNKASRISQSNKNELRNGSDGREGGGYNRAELEESLDTLNHMMKDLERSFEFTIHESTERLMIRVLNSDTEEIIREIPPEKILDIVASIEEMVGILVDERL